MNAANAIAGEAPDFTPDYDLATEDLTSLKNKVDGAGPIPDWMDPSAEQIGVLIETQALINEIAPLLQP